MPPPVDYDFVLETCHAFPHALPLPEASAESEPSETQSSTGVGTGRAAAQGHDAVRTIPEACDTMAN